MTRFMIGDIVSHFKHWMTDTTNDEYMYIYRITGIGFDATHDTEVIMYEPMYPCEYSVFTRTVEDFEGLVDRSKYPTSPQNYKFELINLNIEK